MNQRSVRNLGRLGEGRLEDDPGDPRRRHHAQPARLHLGRPLHHLQPAHRSDRGEGPRRVHVPDQHGPHDVPGRLRKTGRAGVRPAQMKVERVQRQFSVETCTDV